MFLRKIALSLTCATALLLAPHVMVAQVVLKNDLPLNEPAPLPLFDTAPAANRQPNKPDHAVTVTRAVLLQLLTGMQGDNKGVFPRSSR